MKLKSREMSPLTGVEVPRYLWMHLVALTGETFCAQTKQVILLTIWYLTGKRNELPSYKPENGDRYALLKSVTAGVHLQAKGKVDAVCPVHKARQQGSKQCSHPKQKAVGCAGVNHWCVSVYYQLLSLWQC